MIIIMFYTATVITVLICLAGHEDDQPGEGSVNWEDPTADELYIEGMKFFIGTGVEIDLARASKFLRKAALQGHKAALEALFHPDLLGHWSWEAMVDEMEYADSLVRMGRQFQCRLFNPSVHLDLSITCYNKPARLGHTGAILQQRSSIFSDSSVDLDLAHKCYSKAARLGHTGAMLELGECYWFGEGCEEDRSKALEWIGNAAANGNEDARLAMEVIGYSAFESWEDEINNYREPIKTHYIKWLKEQAAAGNTAAMMKLDDLWCNESSMPKEWHELAMEKGDPGGYFAKVAAFMASHGSEEIPNQVKQWFNTAVGILKDRIGKGDLDAWYDLGKGYKRISLYDTCGKLVSSAEREIFKCYLKAAEAGHAEAQYRVGYIYRHSSDFTRDGSKAYEWLLRAAQQGHRKAQSELSIIYGDDVIKDLGEIERRDWLQAAAEKGDLDAQNKILNEYLEGEDNDGKRSYVTTNLPEARRWFFAQAYQGYFGDPIGYENSNNLLYRDDFEALKWLRRAESLDFKYAEESISEYEEKRKHYWVTVKAESGDASALYELALSHLYGWDAETDPGKAVHLLKQAAAAGSVDAYTELGHLHILGINVEKSIDEAISWWNKAAGLGSFEAELALNAIEVFKHEISKDLNEARAVDVNVDECDADNLAFFQTEAKNGDLEAMFKLGDYLIRTKDEQEGFQWLNKAAQAGHPRSCGYLSLCYRKGWGVSRNMDESEKWSRAAEERFSESALAGDATAITGLHELYGVFGNRNDSLIRRLTQDAIVEPDLRLFDLTLKLLHKAACLGDPQAQYRLGSYFLTFDFDDDDSDCQTEPREISWVECSILNPYPMLALRHRHYQEMGNIRNIVLEGIKWLRLSAYQRNLDARLKLGMVFNNGFLMRKNKEAASAWLDLFPNGNTSGECKIIGMGYTHDFCKLEDCIVYIDFNDPRSSMRRIALERGIVEVPEKAVEYFRKAADLGNPAGNVQAGASSA